MKSDTEKTSTTKFSSRSTSGIARSSMAEKNRQVGKLSGKLFTTQWRQNPTLKTVKINENPENSLPLGKKPFPESKKSRYSSKFDKQGKTTVSNECQNELRDKQKTKLEDKLDRVSLQKSCSLDRDLTETKQELNEKSQICENIPMKICLNYSTEEADDGFVQIKKSQIICGDEDLMRLKRINTLYKLNKKLHSPHKTIEEIFSGETVAAMQSPETSTHKDTSNAVLDSNRKCDKSCPKGIETFSGLKIDEIEDNPAIILESDQSVDDGKMIDGNEIADDTQLPNDFTALQNTVDEIQNGSREMEIVDRLETVDEETEPSISNKGKIDCDESSDSSGKSEKEPDDESYEDDWEVDQEEISMNKDKDADVKEQVSLRETKEVESHNSTQELQTLFTSSSTSLSAVSEIKNDDGKLSKSGDSNEGHTYVKEKSPSNNKESISLNKNTLDGLKLSLPSNKELITEANQESTSKDILMSGIEDEQNSIFEKLVESGGSKTFNVVKDVEIDKNNTVTISSSVSSEILQNDGKFDLNSEDFAAAKNTNDNNYLIPHSARSNTTAEIRDSVGVNVDDFSTQKLNSCEIVNDNERRCVKNCTNNTVPHTSFHLSIPEAMEHLQNKITMTSNFENQEFKVILELNKNGISAVSSPRSYNEFDNRSKSDAPGKGRDFVQKLSKAVNTETVVENDETANGNKGLNAGNLNEVLPRVQDDAKGVAQGAAQGVAQGGAQGVAQGNAQGVAQSLDWEARSHDLAQLRNRIEGLESSLGSTVGVVLERLTNSLATGPLKPDKSERNIGDSCNLEKFQSIHSQTDSELLKPTDNLLQCETIDKNQPVLKTSLSDEINKLLDMNRGVERKSKPPVDTFATNRHILQRKSGTLSSSSWSSSLVSISHLSGSEEKSQSELSEGEVGMDAAICSCSFGEIKMSGCSRCGPYGVKKLTMKRSYPNFQRSDGEMSIRCVQKSSSEHSGSHSVDSRTKISLNTKKDVSTVVQIKSKSRSQIRNTSRSFSHVVENIMEEMKKEKMGARIKFKKSQEIFDAQFIKHSECLRRSASEISLRMSASAVDHAVTRQSQNLSSENIAVNKCFSTVGKDASVIGKTNNYEASCKEVISDESGDSEVAMEKLQELDSSSLFRLIRKRKDREAHTKLDHDLVNPAGSYNNLPNGDDRARTKMVFDGFNGKSNAKTVIDTSDKKEVGETNLSNGAQSIEEVLKTFFSSTVSSEHQLEKTQVLNHNSFCEEESSLIRTRKDLLDTDSSNSTIFSNTSDDRDRSEGQIL